MKAELKKVKVFNEMSEETVCFHAELHVNGVKVAVCSNSGKGGSTVVDFDNFDAAGEFIQYCKDNPIILNIRNKSYVFNDAGTRIDEMLHEYLMEKTLKKKQVNALVLHKVKSGDAAYVVHSYVNLNTPVKQLMMTVMGRNLLKTQISSWQNKGFRVMNTNIKFKQLNL